MGRISQAAHNHIVKERMLLLQNNEVTAIDHLCQMETQFIARFPMATGSLSQKSVGNEVEPFQNVSTSQHILWASLASWGSWSVRCPVAIY